MENMQKGDKATNNMDLLVVINATSIQLIPATIIALRASWNSANPSSIILPTLISSTIATVVGVILCKVFSKDNSCVYQMPITTQNIGAKKKTKNKRRK